MNTATLEVEDLAKLGLGKGARRDGRIRRALISRLLNEPAEATDENGEQGAAPDGDDEERQLGQLLVGSRLIKRRRLRRLVLAHLLNERDEAEDEIDEDEQTSDEEGENDGEVARLLIGSRLLRRRRVRRALLAHLIKERGETSGEVEDDGDEFAGDEGGEERGFVRLIIGSRVLRRRRVRRALLAHLLRDEGGTEESEETGDDDADLERQAARFLVGRRVVRRRRMRRALIHYLRDDRADT